LIKPSAGKITINGSIGALIALGTGFNPILTGRENVRIAGAVLGFTEREMAEKLEEIVEFSEIEDFIDAPVKSYSSGMLVRLGFSVAIQLTPDILLVDEVLAVGDLSFAVKCQKKITEYRNNGGSMILVSHGMHNVRIHCDRAIWLDTTKIRAMGESNAVCNEYEMFVGREENQKGEMIYFDESIELRNFDYTEIIKDDEEFIFEFEVKAKRHIKEPIVVFAIFDVRGQNLFKNYSHLDGFSLKFSENTTKVTIKYGEMPLANGVYTISLILHENEVGNHLAYCDRCFSFEIQRKDPILGLLNLKPKWDLEIL
jgi:ABC-2 type transport system ATP-binding protein/lipopolysaccharide transport system ATP-binding protein